MDNVESKIEPQQYNINWPEVINNAINAVIYEVDTDSDGTFDKSINLPPVYKDNIEPTTRYNISGELNTNTTNSYIETVTIDLNSIDNEGGTGVDKIYYAILNGYMKFSVCRIYRTSNYKLSIRLYIKLLCKRFIWKYGFDFISEN